MKNWRPLLKYGLIGIAVVSGVVSALVHNHHLDDPHFRAYWYDTTPVIKDVWGGFLGFVGCWLIIVVSKWLGHAWLQKPEDYYAEDAVEELPADDGGHHGH